MKLSYPVCILLGLSIFLSCQKKEEGPVLPPFKMVSVAEDAFYTVEQFFPEITTSPSIQYDEEMGYYKRLFAVL